MIYVKGFSVGSAIEKFDFVYLCFLEVGKYYGFTKAINEPSFVE